MQRSAFCRSRQELSNAYLLAKFGFDTAENEASKVCYEGLSDKPTGIKAKILRGAQVKSSPAVSGGMVFVGSNRDYLYAISASTGALQWSDLSGTYDPGDGCRHQQTLNGSFSAVSKPISASKY